MRKVEGMNTMKLGDVVVGTYCDATVRGTVVSYDGSCGVLVEPTEEVEIFGTKRDTVYFDRHARRSLRVVEVGPELTEEEVVQHPSDCLGGASLRSWKPKRTA
jgi:hypothetical protein